MKFLPPGSSPLARGLPAAKSTTPPGARIIPARAGFTGTGSPVPGGTRDHPRSRGVYPTRTVAPRVSTGSSPLARGLPGLSAWQCADTRIIPARAGFTCVSHVCVLVLADHPRSRGVYSRPRVVIERSAGIIPARAGFTVFVCVCFVYVWDHPRSRGVYT